MCEKCGCTKSEEEKKDPKECSPEQIKECHGDEKKHPCCGEDKKEESTE